MNTLTFGQWAGVGMLLIMLVVYLIMAGINTERNLRNGSLLIAGWTMVIFALFIMGCGSDDWEPRGSFFIDHAAIIDMTSGPDAFNIKLVGGSRVWIDRCCGTVEIVKGEGVQVEIW